MPVLQLAAAPVLMTVWTGVASPGANKIPTLSSFEALISSGERSSLSSSSHCGRLRLSGMLLVTEMGRSKTV
jgi:hypothetical protein